MRQNAKHFVVAQLLNHVRCFATLWTAAYQDRLPYPSPSPGACLTHVHRVDDAIQPSLSLSAPSPPAFDLSQY